MSTNPDQAGFQGPPTQAQSQASNGGGKTVSPETAVFGDAGEKECNTCIHTQPDGMCDFLQIPVKPDSHCCMWEGTDDQDPDQDQDKDQPPLAQQAANALNAKQPPASGGGIGSGGKRNTFAGMMQR